MKAGVEIVATGELVIDHYAASSFSDEIGEPALGSSESVPPVCVLVHLGDLRAAALAQMLDGAAVPLVHLGEHARFHAPVHAGQQFACSATVRGSRPMVRGFNVVVENCVRDTAGTVCVQAWTTLQVLSPDPLPIFGADAFDEVSEPDTRPRAYRQLAEYVPDQGIGERWAQITGDWQPIHLDDDVARAVGFRSQLVHGTHSLAMAARLLAGGLSGTGSAALRSLSLRFGKPIYPGEQVRLMVAGVGDGLFAFRGVAGGRAALRNGWVEVPVEGKGA